MGVSNILLSRSTNSSAFMLGKMKDIYTNKVKERVSEDGLDPKYVTSECSDKLAKAMTMAVAMGDNIGKPTNKKCQGKQRKDFKPSIPCFWLMNMR